MSQFCRAAYLLVGLVLAAFLVGQAWNPAPPPPFCGLEGVVVPDRIAGYRSAGEVALPEKTRTELRGSDFIARTYTDLKDVTSSFDFALLAGTDRTALHDPRGCMIGAGWTIENDHTEILPETNIAFRFSDMVGITDTPADAESGRFGAPDRVARSGARYEVLYTYLVDGKIVQQVTQIRGQMLFASLIGQSSRPVYYCLFMRPRRDDPEQDRREGQKLRRFAADMWRKLDLEMLQKKRLLPAAERRHSPSASHDRTLEIAVSDREGGA